MEDGILLLNWGDHNRNVAKKFSLYRDQALYSDVTLAFGGMYFHVHKIILSSCSEYFQEIFSITQCKQPVIVFKDIRQEDAEQILQYIYTGEVEVKQSGLGGFLKLAEYLKIKGLATPDDDDLDEEIPIKSKRKRDLSDTQDSPKKHTKYSTSNSDDFLDLTSENAQPLYEPKELVKTAFDDTGIDEEIDIKYECNNLKESVIFNDNSSNNNSNDNSSNDNYIDKEMPYAEKEPQKENFGLSNPGTPVPYLSDSAHSGENEPKDIETSKYCIKRKNGNLMVYSCSLCLYSTQKYWNFTLHVRKHTGEKPYKCQYCDYCATQKQVIKIHERTHTGEKPYSCKHCSFRSAQKQSLKYHQKTKHRYL